MSDLGFNPYYTPLDNLVGSSGIGSRQELAAEQMIGRSELGNVLNQPGAKAGKQSFDEVLKQYSKSATTNNPKTEDFSGCHPLIPIACDYQSAIDNGQQSLQEQIDKTIQNITNADKPGYKKVLPFLDKFGNVVVDQSTGTLERTNWYLDLAIAGEGKGFKLANGEYTRDGRFRLDAAGKPVTVEGGIPLEICYKDGASIDWSMKELKIDLEGKVLDVNTGLELGHVVADKKESGKVLQKYLEKSNVNLPVEFMGLAQKFRLFELTSNIFATGSKLDGEAIQLARNT
ncbi:MAG: flagellar basal body rod C-terminal domain-containing protein [Candidatus Caenarcaniphilales bacterium]|nr:flagellar basal body rod C-terminal domain-containing protein [Candidatus Caenarcaniphilales bacterium]